MEAAMQAIVSVSPPKLIAVKMVRKTPLDVCKCYHIEHTIIGLFYFYSAR